MHRFLPTGGPWPAAIPGRMRVALFLVIVVLPLLGFAQEQRTREAILLDIDGAIGPATTDYVQRGLETARERDAALVILRMDTPGGLDLAMREIIQSILGSQIPIATYVAPSGARAASAGTYILYASHIAAMAPGTNLGAATPIQLGGGSTPLDGGETDGGELEGGEAGDEAAEEPEGQEEAAAPQDAATAKAINDAVAYIRGLADLRDRNADWAEQAVRQAASLSSRAALERNVIDLVASDVEDLLRQADGRVVTVLGEARTLDTADLAVVAVEPDWRTRLLEIITDPNIAYILLLVGIYGIIFELASPGTIGPGVIGAISLLLGLFALNLLPIDYAGLGLTILGIALMVAEALVPAFGVLGIGGAVAFAIGSVIMFDFEAPGFGVSLTLIGVVTAASAALMIFALAAVIRAHRRRAATGTEALVGSTGQVLDWSGQTGRVRVQGERWHAKSDDVLVSGQDVRVKRRDDLTLVVEPVVIPSQGERVEER